MRSSPTALVTGASSGIGAAFATALAQRAFDLVLVARRADRLEELGNDLAFRYGRRVHVLPADLLEPEAPSRLKAALDERGIAVNLLINNAGVGFYDEFTRMDAEQADRMVLLNVRALTSMSRAFLPDMSDRGHGAVINVASTAAFQAIPYGAVYAATKAYVLSFSEALAEEMAPRGVRVLCVCPGSTESEIHQHSQVDPTLLRLAPMMSAEAVVEETLRALDSGRRVHVPGPFNEFHALVSRMVPREIAARLAGNIFRPGRWQQ